MGDGVNIAARLQSIAKPGGICISDDTYRQVKSRLDLKVSDLGPVPLKNIAEPMRAYSLEVGAPAQAKPAKLAEPMTPPAPAPQKRRFGLASLAAALAALMVVIAGGAWWFLNANRPTLVASNAPQPARGPTPFHRGAAFRQSVRRSGAGLSRRRANRSIDHQSR